jgi:hypothetical protein
MSGVNVSPFDTVVGPGSIWVAPVGTSFPVVDLATPAAAWTSLGETDGGCEFTAKRTVKKHVTDQSFAPKKTTVLTKEIELGFTLAQVTLERLAYVLDGQAVTSVAAVPGVSAGYKSITLSSLATLPQYAMLIRVPSPYQDGYLQFEFPKVSPSGDQKMSYKKDEQTLIPTTWDVLEDPSNAGQFGTLRAFTAAS